MNPKRWLAGIRLGLLLLAGPASAQAPTASPSPAPPAPSPEPPKLEIALAGYYEFNGYTQHDFFLGRNASGISSDHDDYMVNLFRVEPIIRYGPGVKGVMSIALGQKIFGLDSEVRDIERAGFTNAFNRKDTHFFHVDDAYLEFAPPKLRGFTVRLGRMRNDLGSQLVVDQDGDGIQIVKSLAADKWRLTLDWTKEWEGANSLTDDNFAGGLDGRDANLFYASLSGKVGKIQIDPFVAFYDDSNSNPYVPGQLQYFNARFTPNLSRATALGFAWKGALGKATFKGEGDYLFGKDKIKNASSGPNQLLDVNNGDLSGHNLYLDIKVPLGRGLLGGTFGLGSGDRDPMSGKGNINRIRTQGFFYVTEVWEDSIMTDERGITPQGLGSPASRGYREFENTTLLQVSYSLPFGKDKDWTLLGAGTLLRATQPLHPWRDVNGSGAIDPGEFSSESSKDLGKEMDLRIDWKLLPSLTWTLRGGVMFAGNATGYLVNGTNRFSRNPWELRTTVRFNFGGRPVL